MIFSLLAELLSILFDLITLIGRSDQDKDVEILLLRQQLRILQRHYRRSPRIAYWEKLTLVVFARKLTAMTTRARTRLAQVVFLFKPDTLLKWHRELVRRKWTFRRGGPPGRPRISSELEALIIRLAKENPRWGYGKLEGELLKLGYDIGRTTIKDVLKRRRLAPAPERAKRGSTWRSFLRHYQDQILACDFFTVETAWLKTLYVVFFIELGSRRVHLGGCTANPTHAWVTQQAPVQAPNANAFAERWIRSVREECLDKILILGECHLQRVLSTYVTYYNHARPHQGIEQQCPVPLQRSTARDGPIERRDMLGGVLHDYYRYAA